MASLDSSTTNKHEGMICGRLAEAEAAQEQKTYLSPDPSLLPPQLPVGKQLQRTEHRALANPDLKPSIGLTSKTAQDQHNTHRSQRSTLQSLHYRQ
jgi:hypothetical protein